MRRYRSRTAGYPGANRAAGGCTRRAARQAWTRPPQYAGPWSFPSPCRPPQEHCRRSRVFPQAPTACGNDSPQSTSVHAGIRANGCAHRREVRSSAFAAARHAFQPSAHVPPIAVSAGRNARASSPDAYRREPIGVASVAGAVSPSAMPLAPSLVIGRCSHIGPQQEAPCIYAPHCHYMRVEALGIWMVGRVPPPWLH